MSVTSPDTKPTIVLVHGLWMTPPTAGEVRRAEHAHA